MGHGKMSLKGLILVGSHELHKDFHSCLFLTLDSSMWLSGHVAIDGPASVLVGFGGGGMGENKKKTIFHTLVDLGEYVHSP